MKAVSTPTLAILLCHSILLAQIPITQVEGYLEVYHPEDSTSLYIGNNSGIKHSILVGNQGNTFVGSYAGAENTGAIFNSLFGFQSGNNLIDDSANLNSFFGAKSGYSTQNGYGNSFFGEASGFDNINGTNNSFFGIFAGAGNVSGWDNIAIGWQSRFAEEGLFNSIVIGAHAQVKTSNTILLGRSHMSTTIPGNLIVGQDIPTIPNPEVKLLVKSESFPTLTIESTDDTDPKIQLTNSETSQAAADSDWTIRMDVSDDLNTLEWRYDNEPKMWLRNNGLLGLSTLPTIGGSVDLCWNNLNKYISFCTTPLGSLKSIQDFKSGLELVYKLRPVSYFSMSNNSSNIGFIAEELAKIDERLITRNDDGQIISIRYRQLTAILVNAIKEQQAEIKELKKQIETNSSLEKRIKHLEKLISSSSKLKYQDTED